MRRRTFLEGAAATGALAATPRWLSAAESAGHPTYATVADAIAAPPERTALLPVIRVGTPTQGPDYMATVDVDPGSSTYSQVISRFALPTPGDELHHFGWNACSSCHGEAHRRYLIVPGLASGNIYVLDAANPRALSLHHTISAQEIAEKTNLSTPHTVHCRDDGVVMISMLGDAQGEAPGGFLEITPDFRVKGRWAADLAGMHFNYDFWYQVRQNTMVSSEWAAPNTVKKGFQLEDVQAGKYGHRLHFWDWEQRKIEQTVDLGEAGMIPLEVRFHHNPDSTQGFVGAALSSAIFHWQRVNGKWVANRIVQVDPVETKGWPFPVPGLITDLVLSLDDKYLYFSNWLHGDIRQYDVSDPAQPRLVGQVWLGGVIGRPAATKQPLVGGPQMLQLSRDGKRLYVTSSLYSVWDNQFYPDMAQQGSWMLQIDCDTQQGGLKVNPNFHVDFGQEPGGPARAHEIRFPSGDCTSDIWV